jgi:SAM-dependent methyltransferase
VNVVADQDDLFAYYVARGHEAWNTSTDAAWLDFQLRDWVEPLIPAKAPKRVCNVGIGVGLWDDWLGHVLDRRDRLISLDLDPEVCRVFSLRQARERHPLPALVVRGDVRAGALPAGAFDLITAINVDELGDRESALAALLDALAPDGRLIVTELADVVAAPNARVLARRHARRGELALSLAVLVRD